MKWNRYLVLEKMLRILAPVTRVFKVKKKKSLDVFDLKGKSGVLSSDIELLPTTCDLSLIIPVYNAEKYLRRCLDSLLNQNTKYQYELILINDGSKDSSGRILEEYEKKDFRVKVFTQENQGISAARNAGIERASGRYIGFVDNDDFVTSSYCETLLARAYQTDADIVKCGHFRYDIAEERVVAEITSPEASITGELGDAIVQYKGFIWSGIYKKTLFENICFPVGFWYEDMIGRILLMRKCRQFEFVQKSLYYYCLHQTNASKTVWKESNEKVLDQLFLAEKLAEYGKEIGLGEGNGLYKTLMIELGPVLWMRCRNLKGDMLKLVFFEASDFLSRIKPEKIEHFTKEENCLYKAFRENNYYRWYMESLIYMCGVKGNNGRG